MKILMTTDTAGGVWHYALDLASALLKDQVDVVLVGMGPNPDKGQMSQVKKLERLTFLHKPYKLEWMDDPWEDVAAAGEWIKDIVNKESPDLLHFNNYAHVNLGWTCPTVLVAHSCVASWWKAVKKEMLPAKYKLYFETVKRAMHTADILVSPSYRMLQVYQELYGPFRKEKVIYNGIDITNNHSAKQPVVFSIGRIWDEAKNTRLLLDAAKQIRGKIYIAGNKGHHNYKSLPPNVTFLGQLSRQEIFDWLKISAIYVLPVKYEPFGLSFLEAACHQCALIGGDIPTLKELWEKNMIYTSTVNPGELARKCNALLTDLQYCRAMGKKAYDHGRKYSLEVKKNHYLNLYQSMQVAASNF